MKTPTFSLLHATRGRSQKALDAMRLWLARCSAPKEVEYIFAVDPDDRETAETVNNPTAANAGLEAWSDYVVVGNPGFGSAPAWDAAYKASSGDLLIQVSDDFIPPPHWDKLLLERLPAGWRDQPWVICVNDGIRKDHLLTILICTAEFANQQGEFLHAGFQSMFSDNDVSARAEKAGCVIMARDLLFQHRHHSAFPEVANDATYKRQNSSDAYKRGYRLFARRNFPQEAKQ
jgi:hypothetical protein